MKKSVIVRVFCLIVAVAVLSGAMAVAAINGSPYETLKKATLDALTHRNATVEGSMKLTVNGEPVTEEKSHYISGDDSFMSWNFDLNGNSSGYTFSSNGLSISPEYVSEDGTQWYFARVNPRSDYDSYWRGGLAMFSPADRESSQMRFIELLADALIGDLKNNITMSTGDGVRVITGTLTESQIPELAKAGIDMFVEQSAGGYYGSTNDISFDGREYVYEQINIRHDMKECSVWKQAVRPMTAEENQAWENGTFYDRDLGNNWYGLVTKDGITYVYTEPAALIDEYTVPAVRADFDDRDPMEMPMAGITINYVNGEAEIDNDGNLLSLKGNATITCVDIFGDTSVIEFDADVRISDIGSSNPVCPIPGAEQLFTPDHMKTLFGNEYMNVYFTLNADGSIDESSITTTFPGELDKYGYYGSSYGPSSIQVSRHDGFVVTETVIGYPYEVDSQPAAAQADGEIADIIINDSGNHGGEEEVWF